MRLTKPAVALAAAALMTVAACGGGSGGGRDSEEPQTLGEGGDAGSAKDPDAKGPLAVPDDAQEGGTLTVDTIQVPSTLDPTQAYYVDSTAILSDLVTRALTQYAYVDGEMVLVPDMATDLGTPNADNTEWTFTLQEGLKYEDGTDVTAEDVAYSVKRSFATKELPEGPTYGQTFFLDGDKYKGPFSDGDDYKGVEVNGNDITIKMSRPFTDMDYYASFPQFTAIPQAKDDPATYGKHPLATGPYMFEDYKPGTSLTLVKNDQWDPDTDPGRIQSVDRWEFNFGQEQAKFENVIINDSGSAQTTLTYDNASAPAYRSIQEEGDRLVEGTSPCTYMWYLDQRKIKELEVRKALGWAYPYQNAWRAAGLIEGVTRQGGTTILPPGTAGRKEFDVLGNKGIETDPEKSKALLKEAGYAPGEYEIKWYFKSDEQPAVDTKDEVVRGLEAGGFKATPIASTAETIRTDDSVYEAPVNVRSSGWCSDWPTGGSWFPAQWDGDLVGLDGMPNLANIKEADLDKEQDRILDELTPEEAAGAWGEFDETIMTKYFPVINIGYDGSAFIHGSKVGGMESDSVRGMPTFQTMYVAQ